MEFTVTTTQIIWLCSFIGALWGLAKVIKEIRKPNEDLKKEVKEHSHKLKSDEERIKDIETSNHMILQSLFVIINHDITGNGIDKLRNQRDELQEFLSNK